MPRSDECCKEDLVTDDYKGKFVKAGGGVGHSPVEEDLEEEELVV